MPSCSWSAIKKWMLKEKLLILTITSVVIGVALGFIMRSANFDELQRYYWGFPGDVIMMHMLKCIIVPLIIFSILTGVASLAGSSGKLSLYAVIYYLTTTVIAIIIGIVTSVAIKPGSNVDRGAVASGDAPSQRKAVVDGLLDIIRNCFPNNIVEATFDQASTARVYNNGSVSIDVSYGGSQNVLGLIVFCSMFGYYLGKIASEGNKSAEQALALFNGLNDAIMAMVDLIMWYVPIGLLFLISNKIMGMGDDMGSTWAALGMFILTSIVALVVHGFIVLPLLYFILVRKNPFTYLAGVAQAMVTAFANASSAATMPITMRNLELNNKIDIRVTRFMLPLGATINMDGTALYEAVAALFIAQLSGINLGFGEIITVAVTSTAASIGAAAVPSAGLITLIIVLTAVGLPTDDIALILTVDWFLDRIRTAINVWGDSVGCGIVAHFAREELANTPNHLLKENQSGYGIDNCSFANTHHNDIISVGNIATPGDMSRRSSSDSRSPPKEGLSEDKINVVVYDDAASKNNIV